MSRKEERIFVICFKEPDNGFGLAVNKIKASMEVVVIDKGILLCGNLIVDLVKTITAYPSEGMLCFIREEEISTGGMATNNAINLKRLDPALPVGVMGKVGDDDYGHMVLERLKALGVDTHGIIRDKTVRTSFTDVFSVESTGARTFFHHAGANAMWGFDDILWEGVIDKYDWVQLGYILLLSMMDAPETTYGTQAARALAHFRKLGLTTCIDLVSTESDRMFEVVRPALKYVNHLIINEIEALHLTGIPIRNEGKFLADAAFEAAELLLTWGVESTVIIHAPEGAVGITRQGERISQPSHRLEPERIRGTVGAGDAFCSGVMYGLKSGWDLALALRLGTTMGAMNLLDKTATGGARPLSEVMAFMEQTPYRD